MKILLASAIAPEAIADLAERHQVVQRFGADEASLVEAIAGCEALVFRSGVQITERVLAAGTQLHTIIRAGSGYDNIDLDALGTMKVRFVRVPGPGAKAVAELAFAHMLNLSRQVRWADGEWRRGNWVKRQARGRLLTGRVLGVVGAGNIGTRTGRLGVAWDMEVLGCVEHPTADARQRLTEAGIRLTGIDEVLAESDYVCVHVPLQESTRMLIGPGELAHMKPGAFLVNMARGGVVDELALREALLSGHLAGAALDVHAEEGDGNISPLADLENVILTPHIGAATIDSQREIGALIVRGIEEAPADLPDATATAENFIVLS